LLWQQESKVHQQMGPSRFHLSNVHVCNEPSRLQNREREREKEREQKQKDIKVDARNSNVLPQHVRSFYGPALSITDDLFELC